MPFMDHRHTAADIPRALALASGLGEVSK